MMIIKFKYEIENHYIYLIYNYYILLENNKLLWSLSLQSRPEVLIKSNPLTKRMSKKLN